MKYRKRTAKSREGELGKGSRCCKISTFMFPVHQKCADVCWQSYSQSPQRGYILHIWKVFGRV